MRMSSFGKSASSRRFRLCTAFLIVVGGIDSVCPPFAGSRVKVDSGEDNEPKNSRPFENEREI